MSVVVCAHNEKDHIARLLTSLTRQSLRPLDVIVVDDGSTDATAAIAEANGASVVRLPHRGPAIGRNMGAALSRGDVLVFLDGDMACAPEFLDHLTAPMHDDRVMGTFTREVYVANLNNRWARAYGAVRQHGGNRLLPPDFPDTWDNFRAIRRDLFLRAGGYDDIGYGEDRTIARKIAASAVVAPGAVCFHYNPQSPREIFANGRWIGRGSQIRDLPRPWHDHLPHRVVKWLWRDLRSLDFFTAAVGRLCYHGGVALGLIESTIRPGRHWK